MEVDSYPVVVFELYACVSITHEGLQDFISLNLLNSSVTCNESDEVTC